jgi:L-lysine 2,3-aminomutase
MARRRQDKIQWMLDYFSEHPCVDCGETDPVVLEFDHVRGEKVAAISFMIPRGYPMAKILAEVDKCDVRCANCHRRKTAKERNWYAYAKTLDASD